MNQQSTKPEPIARRSTRVIQSKIGRYIRGEISADLIHKSNVQVVCTTNDTNVTIPVLNNCAINRQRKQLANLVTAVNAVAPAATSGTVVIENAKTKGRPPFRQTVNAKNTSFVSAVSDLKRMKLDESKSSPSVQSPAKVSNDLCLCLAEPDVQSMCLCENETMKKFVPEPGAYLLAIKRKLSHIRHKNTDTDMLSQVLSHYDSASEDNENFEIWQCN